MGRREREHKQARQSPPPDALKHPSKKRRKPHTVEWRIPPQGRTAMSFPSWGEWSVYRRYATETARKQALEVLSKETLFEYRIPPSEE